MKKIIFGANENCWAICAEGDVFFSASIVSVLFEGSVLL